jgi:predicted nuclease of predicted toxin-antitoxin system
VKFLIDECVDEEIVEQLRRDNHTIIYVAEIEMGISDDEVLSLSNQSNVVLLTADKDFGELIFRQRKLSHGVILIRLHGLTAKRKAEIVSEAITKHQQEMVNAFTVISHNAVRIRTKVE